MAGARSPDDRAALTQALEGHLNGATQHFESEHRIQHRDGSYRWMLARGTAVRDHTGRATRVVGSQTDVTDRRQAEQRLQHDALHDALTGLPNRVLFLDRLAQAILRAQRSQPTSCAAVLFLDLDRFKLVNDSLGHHVGDRLLIAVARRLESALRPGDTVARLGGDEFTILLDNVCDAREATLIAERVQHTLQDPFHLDGRELVVAASIGIALADPDADPADVMRDADVAMYRAKADGKGRHAVFDAAHARAGHAPARHGDRAAPRDRGRRAGGRLPADRAGGDGPDRRLRGAVPLARADGESVEPAEFVPIAEETGLIVPLGRHVLETACRQLAEWRQLPGGAGLMIGVNVSHRQLSEPSFATELAAVLSDTGLDPRALRLEVREHDLARDPEPTRRTLAHVLETLGVRWQIDDFGTGASSLHLLHRFPGDAIKIFGPLVSGMGHDGGSFEIVKAIIELAHNLGLEVIAEGVEEPGQLEHLRVLGCEFAQGFHIAAPLAANDARALLSQGALAV